MIRQRVNLRTPVLAYAVRALTVLLAVGLLWYGLMAVLLAVKVSAHTVNAISGYRTLWPNFPPMFPSRSLGLIPIFPSRSACWSVSTLSGSCWSAF